MSMPATGTAISRRKLLFAGGAFACAGLAAGSSLLPLRQAIAREAGWPAVDRLIDSWVGGRRVANMVAALGWGQDEPQFISRGTLAFDSQARAGPDTLYRLYSMTKPVTGIAATMLIDEGALGLDQPLAEILPAFAEMQVQKVYDGPIDAANLEPAERPITIRHLLTHTAGLGYTIAQQGPLAAAYRENGLIPMSVSAMEGLPMFAGTPAPSLEVFADRLATMPLVSQPGTRWIYSVSLDLLGRVIEVASGQPFDEFLQQRLFEPCGMTSTWFRVPRAERSRLTTNYYAFGQLPLPLDPGPGSVFLDEPAFPFGGAGLVSSPRDYDRFLQMIGGYGLIEGRRVMSAAAVRLATSDLLPATIEPGGGFREGFGFGAGGLVGMGMADGLFGWAGAASTVGMVNLKLGLRHSLYTQVITNGDTSLQEDFPAAVAADAMRIADSGQ